MGVREADSRQLPAGRKKWWETAVWFVVLSMCGCSARPANISRVALLAPFEGRYREIGYNALYAAKLAFQDFANSSVELLAVDDGGTVENASDRARALAQDPLVKAVVIQGLTATEPDALQALGEKPVVVVGSWGVKPATTNIFVLSSPLVDEMVTVGSRVKLTDAARYEPPLSGGELFALEQFTRLRPSLAGVRILSSSHLPDAVFTERYKKVGLYVPTPGLLATLTYDAFGMVLTALTTNGEDLAATLATMTYDGYNGTIHFEGGYWWDAPVHQYEYDLDCVQREREMCLIPAD